MLTHIELLQAIAHSLHTLMWPALGARQAGKVRDVYTQGDEQIIITTDRVSGFDRVLGTVPHKGQVLNQLSAWWFAQTRDIIDNHLIAMPDPNVTIARRAEPLPVEVIVRGYITGVTSTSLWRLYEQGERQPYGIALPDGLRKNDPLPAPIITPTTKASGGAHDERLTCAELLQRGLVAPDLWQQVEAAALALFARGQALARQAGLILVDTKYEFGLRDGQVLLIDELHTPDSSRFWAQASYDASQPQQEPENMDKEFLRLWYVAQGYRGEGSPPPLPAELAAQTAARYIAVYEQLTGSEFVPGARPIEHRIMRNLEEYGIC
jgi:phosphoribosylaminoimidazole-succinocarboxamide synthase